MSLIIARTDASIGLSQQSVMTRLVNAETFAKTVNFKGINTHACILFRLVVKVGVLKQGSSFKEANLSCSTLVRFSRLLLKLAN